MLSLSDFAWGCFDVSIAGLCNWNPTLLCLVSLNSKLTYQGSVVFPQFLGLTVAIVTLPFSSALASSVTVYFKAENLQGSDRALSAIGLAQGDTIVGGFTYDDSLPSARRETDNELLLSVFAIDNRASAFVDIFGTRSDSVAASVTATDVIESRRFTFSDTFDFRAQHAFPGISQATFSMFTRAPDDAWSGLTRTIEELNDGVFSLSASLEFDNGFRGFFPPATSRSQAPSFQRLPQLQYRFRYRAHCLDRLSWV